MSAPFYSQLDHGEEVTTLQEVKTYKPVHDGDVVIFRDSLGRDHNALVTCVHGGEAWRDKGPTINIVHLDANEGASDSYGRQRVLPTSICHWSRTTANGMHWRHADEEPTIA